MFGLSERSLYILKETISRFPEIQEAIVFGSRAMGNYKKRSDVDIAIKGEINDNTVSKLSALLNQEVPLVYHFDIVDYHSIKNMELVKHIDRFGKPINL